MAFQNSSPFLSLINAAYSTGAADSLGLLDASFIPIVLPWEESVNSIDIEHIYYYSMLLSMSGNGERIKTGVFRWPIEIREDHLARDFNSDFRNINDVGTEYRRGNDNTWLGDTGDNPGEWPVSYYGTGQHNAESIAETGYRIARRNPDLYGKGIYSTSNVEIAKRYATEFEYGNHSFKCIVQNRVNPNPHYRTVIPVSKINDRIYWVSNGTNVSERDLIRPYGICLFQLE